MLLACPLCHAEYDIDERRVPRGGVNVRCPKCQGIFPVRAPPEQLSPLDVSRASSIGFDRVPLPAPTSPTGSEDEALALEAAMDEPRATSAPTTTGPERPREAVTLGFGEVDFAEPSPPLGNEEPFPFDTADATFSPSPTRPAPAATVPPPARAVAAPDVVPGSLPGAGDPFASAAPLPPSPAETPAAASRPPDPDPAHTDLASMLPEPTSRDGTDATEEVASDEILEELFEPEPAPATFTIRRPSGKVFGPFGAAKVLEMLERGELLGNEEVSEDGGSTYRAMGEVAAFREPLRLLAEREVEGAARPASPKVMLSTAVIGQPAAGRARNLVARSRRGGGGASWRWIAAASALACVLAIGVGAGFTRYGFFFHRVVRGHNGPQRPGAKLVVEARLRLAEDRFATVKAAVELADQALRLQPTDVEAKATYTYAVSLLARRHGGATAAWSRARGYLPELTKLAGEDPEAAKAALGAALTAGERPPEVAAGTLERHLAKGGARDGDALLVMGDAALARADVAQAAAFYGKLEAIQPASARVSHALGVTAARRGELAGAQRLFEAALAQDRLHLASAVELGRVALAAGDRARAESLARGVLAAEVQSQVGPRERARARSVLGLALARAPAADLQASLAAAERELEAATREAPDDVEPRLALANFQLDRGAPEKASATLAPVLAQAQREPGLAIAQARVVAMQGRTPEALALLDAALDLAPGDARLVHAKGVLSSDAGKQGDADRFWVEAVAKAPAAFEPHLAIAQARFRRGDLEGAEKELKLAVERAPGHPRVVSLAADLLLARRDLGGAEAGYRRALSIDAAHGEGYLGLARVAVERGDTARARAELERAVVAAPRVAAAQALYGDLLWKARELPAARKALQAAVALDAHDAVSRAHLGAIELLQGERDAAVADLQAAAQLEVASAEVRAWYGRALVAKGELQPGIEQLRKSIELDPRDGLVHLQLGQALERVASVPEAIEAYRAAQARAPQMVAAYEALGALYASLNRCADALPQLEKAVALAARDQRLRVAVADCKARLGRNSEAVAIYRRVLDADPKQVGLYYRIARAQHEATGVREALPWYERATREEPSNAMPYYYLGFAYKVRGQPAKAIAAFHAYLRTKPDAEDRKDIEREIEDLGGTSQAAANR